MSIPPYQRINVGTRADTPAADPRLSIVDAPAAPPPLSRPGAHGDTPEREEAAYTSRYCLFRLLSKHKRTCVVSISRLGYDVAAVNIRRVRSNTTGQLNCTHTRSVSSLF